MDALHERIRHAIETQCDTNVESSLHTHSVSTADVIKAVKRLKIDQYNDDGIIMSNNFQHGTYLLYTRIAQLFSAMLYYGYTRGVCRISQGGGGPNFKISVILDLQAAKLRAFAMGVWGHAPPRNFLKMVQFRAF